MIHYRNLSEHTIVTQACCNIDSIAGIYTETAFLGSTRRKRQAIYLAFYTVWRRCSKLVSHMTGGTESNGVWGPGCRGTRLPTGFFPRGAARACANKRVYALQDYFYYLKAIGESGWSSRYSDWLRAGRPRGSEFRVPVGSRIFSSPRRPERLWGPPSLLSNGYRG
jgi:hypothetical protein